MPRGATRSNQRPKPAASGRTGSWVESYSFAGHRGREHVAAAPHRLDDLRVAGIDLEFFAKATHLRVDAAVETCRRTTARQIEKLVAIEHTLRSLDQRDQQIVFAGAQRHRDTI